MLRLSMAKGQDGVALREKARQAVSVTAPAGVLVAKRMVDTLEEESPGCFVDLEATFADLYMNG